MVDSPNFVVNNYLKLLKPKQVIAFTSLGSQKIHIQN